jgi:hypothetical protein
MSKLPKIEDWKAPWEVDLKEGDDPKEALDLDKLKRYIHGVLGDKERLQDANATLTTEAKSLKDEKAAKEREGETTEARLTRERDEALKKAEEAGKTSVETLKLRVALEKGLTKTQVKRLVGTTEEELSADADELLAEWGPVDPDRGEGNDDLLRQVPVARPRAGGDPKPNETVIDVDKAADAYIAGRSIFG